MTRPLAGSGLRRLLTAAPAEPDAHPPPAAPADPLRAAPEAQPHTGPEPAEQFCELCAAPVVGPHRHLVDLTERALRCACRPCALLFDSDAAGRYRTVPERRWLLTGFTLDDASWESLRIPVEMAFFFHDTGAGRTVGFYPSPAGAVESQLDLATWAGVSAANPVLAHLTPDVEAVLVNRAGGERTAWLVPIDDCYTLVGLIRTHWTGLAGGPRVWEEISGFLDDLRARSRTVPTKE
jgi:hypothetical protein